MKWSNSALALIAALSISASVYLTIPFAAVKPTSVISVTPENGSKGGGFSVVLPKDLTSHQAHLLAMAYSIAKKDGHKQPQILQGILIQESKAGTMNSYKVAGQEMGLKTNERYYGVSQIKLMTAKEVIKHFPKLRDEYDFHTNTDEEIIAKLIENDEFNLSVASKYLVVLKGYGFDTIDMLARAYNQGPTGAKNRPEKAARYASAVMKNIQQLKPAIRS